MSHRRFRPLHGILLLLLLMVGSAYPAPRMKHSFLSPPTAQAAPNNDRLAIQVGSDGRFNIGAFPDANGDAIDGTSWDLLFSWPNTPGTSFTTIRVDGTNYVYGTDGTQVQAPTDIDPQTNSSIWRVGASDDIEVTQRLQLTLNPQTGQEDTVRIAYTIQNTGSTARTVGARVMLDTELNYNDGAPFRVPGAGIITTEREFLGSAVPDTFQVFL